MQIDPRTVARDIPGVFDEVFPQLTPGVVLHFNLHATKTPIQDLPKELLEASLLQRAMLFELAYSVADNLLAGTPINWSECSKATLERQRVYFDARLPEDFDTADMEIAELVGRNLAETLRSMSDYRGQPLVKGPHIPGYEWIGSGKGDFAIGDSLIEVKCSGKRFSSSDYRQVAMYWLLSYTQAIEGNDTEWNDFTLLNPRTGIMVQISFERLISVISSGRTKIETLQLFQSLVGSRLTR